MAEEWFLVQLKPNSHNIALRNLARQGFNAFLPLLEVTRRKAARFISELRPLFPGYMFVRLDASVSPWRKVNSTLGISRIVSFAASPTPVPTALVDGLISRSAADGRMLAQVDVGPGSPVSIIDGPFAGFVGTVEAMDADKRVWLLLEFMGQSARIGARSSQLVMR